MPGASWFVLAGLITLLAAVARQGSDLLWAVAIGDRIRAGNGVPQSVPFAAAPSNGWANPMALGEIVVSAVNSLGPWALVAFQIALVTGSLTVIIAHSRAVRCREARISAALVLVCIGGVATLVVARMPSLSLVPFALLVVLLMREADHPTWQLWLAVPILGVWGNLHGGVLVGCALLTVHLSCTGGPALRRAFVGVSSLAIVLLTTSAGWHTMGYYRDVLSNEAARQHIGLWAPPSVRHPLDVFMLLAVAALIAMWLRSRPRRWEIVAIAGLAGATLMASRNSIWLLLLLLPLAARGSGAQGDESHLQSQGWKPIAAAFGLLLVGVGWQLSTRGSALDASGSAAVPMVRQLAAGRTVLAVDPYEETFAQAGIRVWAGNPIDAFSRRTQREYLAFTNNGTIPASPSVGLVVVDEHLAATVRAAGWRQVASVSDLLVFERASSASGTTGVE